MPTSPTLEARIERALDRVPPERSLWIALSGGLDSCVLLALAARVCGQRSRRLRAIHVHHGLQAAADDFERHCRRLCAQLGVTLEVVRALAELDLSAARLGLGMHPRELGLETFARFRGFAKQCFRSLERTQSSLVARFEHPQ